MSNRSWQQLSQVLGVLLIVLVAAAAAVALLRPAPGPAGGTASPTTLAVASPGRSPGASPTAQASRVPGTVASPFAPASSEPGGSSSAEPSAGTPTEPASSPSGAPASSPSAEPSVSTSAGVTPSAPTGASPSPSPTLGPTAPNHSIRFLALGFDSQAATTPTPRMITFHSDGPGEVAAHLAHTSEGDVRLCLARKGGPEHCVESDKADLTAATDGPARTTWIVTAIGTGPSSPIADLRLVFRANKPQVTVDGFRFQGTQNLGYNGVEAEFDVVEGSIRAEGRWGGAPRPWQAQLTDSGTGESLASGRGTGTAMTLDALVTPRRVHLSVSNSEQFSDQEVFLRAVIRWP